MTHLRIELNTTGIEEVSGAVIAKLYDLVHSGTLDNTSNLLGRLHTTATYLLYIDYLEGQFDGTNDKGPLYIDATKKYIIFADPEVQRVLMTLYGDGTGITREDMSSVTSLTLSLFKNNTVITSFNELGQFPSIVQIKYDCFLGAANLLSIDLSNIEELGGNAFNGCSLSGIINVPKLENLGLAVFNSNTGITEVHIGSLVPDYNKITTLQSTTFYNLTNLETVTGLKKVNSIYRACFYNCSNLENVDFETSFVDLGGEVFYNCAKIRCIDLSLCVFTNDSGNGQFRECTSLTDLTTFDINNINTGSATYTFNNWTKVPDYMFSQCSSLNKDFILPNVTSIGSHSFMGTKITSISIPSATTIGRFAFNGVTTLTSVNIPSVTSLGNNCFEGCTGLTSIDLSSATTIGQGSFYGCTGLQSVTFDSPVLLGELAFDGCTSLTTITGINKITRLAKYCLSMCSNLAINNPDFSNVTTIKSYCLYNCSSLTGILDMTGVTTVEDVFQLVFSGCSGLTEIKLGTVPLESSRVNSSRTSFYNCTNLKIVDVNSLVRLGVSHADLFLGCSNIKALVIRNTTVPNVVVDPNDSTYITTLDWNLYFGNRNDLKIYVPDVALNDYKTAPEWSNIATHIFPLSDYNEATILAS